MGAWVRIGCKEKISLKSGFRYLFIVFFWEPPCSHGAVLILTANLDLVLVLVDKINTVMEWSNLGIDICVGQRLCVNGERGGMRKEKKRKEKK